MKKVLKGWHPSVKMKSKQILSLLDKYDIDVIENSLIYLFMEKTKYGRVKNKLIKERLRKINPEVTVFLSGFLEENNIELSLKNIERIFELLIEPEDRKLYGAFYTPDFIVDYINKKIIDKKPDFKVCDCSCGSGAFLVLATEQIAKENNKNIINTIENNIYGVDINPRSINRTKIILSLLALQNNEDKEEIKFNVKVGDSLDTSKFNWKEEFPEIFSKGGFDGVMGNPPYVRIQNLNEGVRKFIQQRWFSARDGNIDLYIAFFELGLKLLNENGKLGYITPNSYFSSHAGENLRQILRNGTKIKKILDFNHVQVFEDVMVYTCITILDNQKRKYFDYQIIEKKEELEKIDNVKFKQIDLGKLNNKKWVMLDNKEFEIINTIENKGEKLCEMARVSSGIATLSDKLYILIKPKEKGKCFILNYEGKEYLIEKSITRPIIKASVVRNERNIQEDERYVIFPYKKIGIRNVIIPEQELKKKYPETHKYFLTIKGELDKRDKGKPNPVSWYAFGRSQGLDTSFGRKILTSGINLKPRFVICENEDYAFYSGYAVFYDGDLEFMKKILNSKLMEFYIKKTGKAYSGGYMSYSKTFIQNFSVLPFTEREKEYIKKEDKNKVDDFLIEKYFRDNPDFPQVLRCFL